MGIAISSFHDAQTFQGMHVIELGGTLGLKTIVAGYCEFILRREAPILPATINPQGNLAVVTMTGMVQRFLTQLLQH